MKTKILFLLLLAFTLRLRAYDGTALPPGLSHVDITTLTTNRLTNSAYITIYDPVHGVTNKLYQTVNNTNLVKGDYPATAFTRLNTALDYLASTLRTNGAASNGLVPISTNTAAGYFWGTVVGGGGNTNGLAGTNFVFQNIADTNTANLTATTNLVNATVSIFGANATNYVNISTNGFVGSSVTNGLTTLAALASTNTANLALTTNLIVAATNTLASTNYVNVQITNSAILINNGTGTNTTLLNANYIGVTNAAIRNDTWLNQSNVHIYAQFASDYEEVSNLVPAMTANNLPSGVVSNDEASASAYLAFDGNPTHVFAFNNGYPHWMQYQFPSPTIINYYAIYQGPIATFARTWTFSGSTDGTNFTVLDSHSGYNLVQPGANVFRATNTTAYTYYRINCTEANNNDGSGVGSHWSVSGIKLAYYLDVNTLYADKALQILSPNGVAINTNPISDFTLNVNSNINVSDNYYINGVPINSTAAKGIYQTIYVTNATGIATNFNGIYTQVGSIPLYTNNTTGWMLGMPGDYSLPGVHFTFVDYALIDAAYSFGYTNSTLFGTYYPAGASPSPGPTVSPYVEPGTYPGGVDTNYVLSAIAATNTANLITTTNLVHAVTNGLVTAAVTNGLASASALNTLGANATNYVNVSTNGFVKSSITNGLVTASITNGLATLSAVASTNTANLTVTTNLVNAATNALGTAAWSPVSWYDTNGAAVNIIGTSNLVNLKVINPLHDTWEADSPDGHVIMNNFGMNWLLAFVPQSGTVLLPTDGFLHAGNNGGADASGTTNAPLQLQNATAIPGGTAVKFLGTNAAGALVMASPGTNLTTAQLNIIANALTNTQYGAALHTPSITSSNTSHAGGVSFMMTDGNDLSGKGGSISLSAGNNVGGGFPGGGILIDGADGGGAGHVIVTNLTVAGSSHLGTIDNFALKTAPDPSGEFLYTFFYSGAPFLDTEQEAFFYENGDEAWNFGTGRMFYGNFTGNGSALTNLNASQLTSGTVPAARLTVTNGYPWMNAGTLDLDVNNASVEGNFNLPHLSSGPPVGVVAVTSGGLAVKSAGAAGQVLTTTASGVVWNNQPPEIIDCIFKVPNSTSSGTSMHWAGPENTKNPWGTAGPPFFPYFTAGTNWNTICPCMTFAPELFVGRTNMQVSLTLASSNSLSIHSIQYLFSGGRASSAGSSPTDANSFSINQNFPGFAGGSQAVFLTDIGTVQTTNITYNIALPMAAQTNNFTQPFVLWPMYGAGAQSTNKSELYYLKFTVILE